MTEAHYRQGSQGSPEGPGGFIRACSLADLPDGDGAIGVEIDGEPVAIIRAEGEVYALRDVCSHAEVPLSEGEIIDGEIECWLHGSTFSLSTGKPSCLPAVDPVPVYPTKIEGDVVYVATNVEL